MLSFHLVGSPWFLLLLPPGLYVLWRQYRGGTSGAVRGAGGLLFALQAMALAVLVASLSRPELRVHRVEFHNPVVLILRDQSTSFQGGGYLGLGRRFAGFEKELAGKYGAGFDMRIVDFAERARPAGPGLGGNQGGEIRLTSMAALSDFLDSSAVANLQAAFLFSDGIANLDSGKGSRTWRTPLYPVVFPPDSVAEAQPTRVSILESEGAPPGAGRPAGTRKVEIEAAWRPVGRPGADLELLILEGRKTLLARKIASGEGLPEPEGSIRRFRFSADLPIRAGMGTAPVRAVLRPAGSGDNFDSYNDTLAVSFSRGRIQRTIHLLRPVRGLDEKAMLDMLAAWEGTKVVFFSLGDSARIAPAAGDQIWVEAGFVSPGGRLHAWLERARAKVVLYSRPGSGRNPHVPGLGTGPWRDFSPSAEIRAGRPAAEVFPSDIVRLKSVATAAMAAPDAGDGAEIWVEAREGGRRGMVMGPVSLGRVKRAFFFCLPPIWGTLFDPQGDFATRENIAAYIRSAHGMAEMDGDAVRVGMPGRVFDDVPFDMEIGLPLRAGSAGPGAGVDAAEFAVSGAGFSRQWPIPPGGARERRIAGVVLPEGAYGLELRTAAALLWRDSLTVAPKAALELARIGFDMEALGNAAARSGGVVISPAPDGPGGGQVTSMLPQLEAAQTRAEKTRTIPLYNTLSQFLLVVLLLSLSWFLRKKWDID